MVIEFNHLKEASTKYRDGNGMHTLCTGFIFELLYLNCALSTNPLSQPILKFGNVLVQLIEL